MTSGAKCRHLKIAGRLSSANLFSVTVPSHVLATHPFVALVRRRWKPTWRISRSASVDGIPVELVRRSGMGIPRPWTRLADDARGRSGAVGRAPVSRNRAATARSRIERALRTVHRRRDHDPALLRSAFFYNTATNFTVVNLWRFWIIHLWVDNFLELFATCAVAIIFYQLGVVPSTTAALVVYLDALLYLGSGIVGTGHHLVLHRAGADYDGVERGLLSDGGCAPYVTYAGRMGFRRPDPDDAISATRIFPCRIDGRSTS